ncbi:MAG: thioredoxin family protein [Thermoleophilia bacterium]
MSVRLLYFDGCPHARIAEERLAGALAALGRSGSPVERVRIDDAPPDERALFLGSPTFLIDGADPFAADGETGPVMACRVYPTDAGPDGAPSVAQLIVAIERVCGIR